MIHSIKAWFKAVMRGEERAQANARYCSVVWLGTFGWPAYLQKERAILRKDKDAVVQ